jgi:hypothetical protein
MHILSSLQLMFTDDAAEDALDYYECRFNRAFRSLRINHVRAAITERKELTDLPLARTEDGDTMLDEGTVPRSPPAASRAAPATGRSVAKVGVSARTGTPSHPIG